MKLFIKILIVLAIVLALLYFFSSFFLQKGPEVSVEVNPNYKQTTYSIIDQDNNGISITTFQTDLNQGILRLRSSLNDPFNEQIKLLSAILDRVFQDEKKAKTHTLFIGRLINAFGENNSQMSERLALAAYNSPLWDKAKGKPVSGHENTFVEKIGNEKMIYPELKKLFSKFGLDLKISGVEKVLIGTPTRYIPFGESLTKQGVKENDKLPFDGLTWFKISTK